MTALADEIVRVLGRRRGDNRIILNSAEIDDVLDELGIPTSASKGTPVRLQVSRVSFKGRKRLDPSDPDAEGCELEEIALDDGQLPLDFEIRDANSRNVDLDAIVSSGSISDSSVVRAVVPFDFLWEPKSGVNGVGSGSNLRGKSSLVNVLLWSLSGRPAEFSVPVKRWIEHVEVDWEVGAERLRVSFDADNGVVSSGSVTVMDNETPVTVLVRFDNGSFEDAMNSVMANRLRLEQFTVSQSGKTVTHRWASYVNALWVRPTYLKSIIGKEPTLSIRLMQMFIGTDWVPVLATAATVAGVLEAEQNTAQDRRKTATAAVESARDEAYKAVNAVKAKIEALPNNTPDPAGLAEKYTAISALARQLHTLETQLLNHSIAADTVMQQLKAVKARQNTELEHALLTKFFHQMEPTACPRCTADVTAARRQAEPDEHKCSVCTGDLNLEALQANVVVANSADAGIASALVASTAVAVIEDGEQDVMPTTEIEALEQANDDVKGAMEGIQTQISKLQVIQDRLVAETNLDEGLVKAIEDRRLLDLDLARAEGAADALAAPIASMDSAPVDPVKMGVAEAAKSVLSAWVKRQQDPLLATISEEIERLVVSFGADGLSNIKLDGAANMTLRQNGDPSTYGAVTPGEKLRLKIATLIALIKHGYVENIGRHPGFLLLDSPAAEEMPDGDLATMMSTLLQVAQEAPMQIIVATRSTGPLVELLPEENRLIAEGGNFVW